MSVRELDEGERIAALAALPLWTYDADARGIRRSFRFADFAEAFGFMSRVAILAEKAVGKLQPRQAPQLLRRASGRCSSGAAGRLGRKLEHRRVWVQLGGAGAGCWGGQRRGK